MEILRATLTLLLKEKGQVHLKVLLMKLDQRVVLSLPKR